MAELDQANADEQPEAPEKRVAKTRQLPKKPTREAVEKPLLVAQNDYALKGVALDYITESGTANSYTFTNGQTFFITNDFTVGPNQTTFEPGCVIKYSFAKNLTLTGPYSFPDTDQTPVFTAKNDDGFGEDVDPNADSLVQSASPALWHYFVDQAMTVKSARFRWALTGIEYDDSGPITHNLKNSLFETTQKGVVLASDTTLQLSDVTKCDVDTPISGGGSTQGAMTDALFCTTTNNFKGINVVDDILFRPPDTHGAIGANHFVEITNEKIVAFERTDGARVDNNDMLTDDFFGVREAFDPRLKYDHNSQRWVACAVNKGDTNIVLAVSSSDSPLQLASDWTIHTINVRTNDWVLDFTTLGVDANGIYISTAHFDNPGFVLAGNTVAAIKKPEIYQGQMMTTKHFVSLNEVDTQAIQPAFNWGNSPNGDKAWFVAKGPPQTGTNYRGGNLFYRSLTWNSSSGRFEWVTSWNQLPTNSDHLKYYDFNSAQGDDTIEFAPPQKGTTTAFTLDGMGSRLMMAFIQDDANSDSEFLWTCHQIGLEGSNFLYSGDESGQNVDRSGVQWIKMEIDSNGGLLSSNLDFGRIRDTAQTSTPYWYYFPSLSVNVNGTALIGFSGSEANEFIGSFFTGRLADGTMPSRPTLIEAGRDEYVHNRWGDYSATLVDPNGTNFWTVQEYAHWEPEVENVFPEPGEIWGTWISEVKPGP